MTDDTQAWIIKIAAVVTATPRWVAALLAAEGLSVPATWSWWLPMSALFSAGMAIVEGLAFAYVFAAWRNQKDRAANNLFWLTILSAVTFIGVLSPYIAASVAGVRLAEILANRASLLAWSAAVAASTITIVVSVGYAQRAGATKSTEPEIADLRRKLSESERLRANAEQRAAQAEQRFVAAGDLLAGLFAEEKRQRILVARQQWPELPITAIAIIAASSPSYVSEVLNDR